MHALPTASLGPWVSVLPWQQTVRGALSESHRCGGCSDGGLVLTRGAIREGCRRGARAYDYVDLGSEEIAQKVHT